MTNMSDSENAERNMICFIVGLLIGGMLVWALSGPAEDVPTVQTENTFNKQSFDACLSAGGVPIMSRAQQLEHCQFKP